MNAIKLNDDEAVYAKQLWNVRREIAKLEIEERTQEDRLLTILRGHQAKQGYGGGFHVQRGVVVGRELIVVTEVGECPASPVPTKS